ncbi:MAG: hypothetical protein LBG92_09340, partial [Prevotellaceae bacterium]|nr:hypothetical protein [Prevotellaceae bacterium]
YTYITEYKLNAEYEKIEKITFKYGDKQYDIDNESIILLTKDRRIPTGISDGAIGAGFLKKLRKVHFDFKNMVFYPEE